MVFGGRLFYIDGGTSYQGIVRELIIRKFGDFYLNLEMFNINNHDMKDYIVKFCKENQYKPSELDQSFDLKLQSEILLSIDDIKSFLPEFRSICDKLNNQAQDYNKLFNVKLFDKKIALILNVFQFNELYNDCESFAKNYLSFQVMYNIGVTEKKEVEPLKQPSTNSNFSDKQELNQKSIKDNEVEQEQEESSTNIYQDTKEETDLDMLMTLVKSSVLKSSIVYMINNYYKYINSDICYAESSVNSNIVNIYLPNLFPSGLIFPKSQIKTLITSISQVNIDESKYILNKILSNFKHKQFTDNPINIMLMSYTFFVYSFGYLRKANPTYFDNNFLSIINSYNYQMKLMNQFIAKYFSEFSESISFNISDINIENYISDNLNSLSSSVIDELSKKYSHVYDVDDELFVKYIFNDELCQDKSSSTKDSIKILNRDIIDIRNLINNDDIKNNEINTIINNDLYSNLNSSDNIFSLQLKDKKITSKYYELFVNYINDKNYITTFINKDNSEYDVEILKLFPTISSFISKRKNIFESFNILYYYDEFIKFLNHAESFSNYTILKIIYNIFLPYNSNKTGQFQYYDL